MLNRCDWYVFFWCLYQMQDILYPQGVINQGIQVLIMGWAVYEAGIYMLPQRELPMMLKATSLLLFMYLVYGSIFIIFGSEFYSTPSNYLKSFVNSFLPLFLFYKYAKEGYLVEKRIRMYFLIFLCMIIPQFFHAEDLAIQALRKKGSSRSEITNNTGYFFVSLLPMLFFWYKNRIVQYIGLCIIMLFILMGMKRGAILIASACAVWFLIDCIKNTTSKKHRYQTVFFGIIISIVAVVAVSYQLTNSEYFQNRVEQTKEGNTSRRDILYSKISDAVVNDESVIHLFFGRGAFATLQIGGNFAHQDWLETTCNNGLSGIVILSVYFIAFYKTGRDAQKTVAPQYKTCLIMLFFASISKSMFSMSLQNIPIYMTMPMAYFTYHAYHNRRNGILPNINDQ